mmetsp:Transcript_31478/g.48186  ORF Transcript_31478/g.48186 Transcript_31478/m.48186 type:complete len:376 (+) Transcript_31478:1-1128(+)
MIVLAIQTIGICLFRVWLNGETKPDFIFDQNPAAFSEDRFTRTMSVNWVYNLYLRDAILPIYLSCDWSGRSIPLIQHFHDNRVLIVLAFWTLLLLIVQSLFFSPTIPTKTTTTTTTWGARRIVLIAFFTFIFSPFLLSSNLLVRVGLMKGDRVIYLPIAGLCILEALAFQMLFCQKNKGSKKIALPRKTLGWILLLSQLTFFAVKLNERNLAWSNSLLLWTSAYDVNPKSFHTMYNCGYELALAGQYERAEQVMRPIADPHVDGPSNTYVYAMTLKNLDKCDEAHYFIDRALNVIYQKKENPQNQRDRSSTLLRTESNLLVVKAMCTFDVAETGRLMYKAVEVDPMNQYARDQAEHLLKKVEMIQKMKDKGINVT